MPDLRLTRDRGADARLGLLLLPGAAKVAVDQLAAIEPLERAHGLGDVCFGRPESITETDDQALALEHSWRAALPWTHAATVATLRGLMAGYLRRGSLSFATTAAQVLAPTLVVWGTRDKLVDVRLSRRATAAYRRAELLVLAGCGHVAQIEEPLGTALGIAELWEGRYDAGTPGDAATSDGGTSGGAATARGSATGDGSTSVTRVDEVNADDMQGAPCRRPVRPMATSDRASFPGEPRRQGLPTGSGSDEPQEPVWRPRRPAPGSAPRLDTSSLWDESGSASIDAVRASRRTPRGRYSRDERPDTDPRAAYRADAAGRHRSGGGRSAGHRSGSDRRAVRNRPVIDPAAIGTAVMGNAATLMAAAIRTAATRTAAMDPAAMDPAAMDTAGAVTAGRDTAGTDQQRRVRRRIRQHVHRAGAVGFVRRGVVSRRFVSRRFVGRVCRLQV